MKTEPNGIASLEDFRQFLAAAIPSQRLKLPVSGLVILVRPLRFGWFLKRGRIPSALAARVAGKGEAPATAAEDQREILDHLQHMLEAVIVEPRGLVEEPEALHLDDLNHLIKYATGSIVVKEDGEVVDLESFRQPKPGGAAAAGSGGVRILRAAE